MTRSKLSSKVVLLAGAIGLSMAAFAGQPAAAQEYTCQNRTLADTARPRLLAETERAEFPRPFLCAPVTRPGSITRDNSVSIKALVEGWATARDFLTGLEDRLLPR